MMRLPIYMVASQVFCILIAFSVFVSIRAINCSYELGRLREERKLDHHSTWITNELDKFTGLVRKESGIGDPCSFTIIIGDDFPAVVKVEVRKLKRD